MYQINLLRLGWMDVVDADVTWSLALTLSQLPYVHGFGLILAWWLFLTFSSVISHILLTLIREIITKRLLIMCPQVWYRTSNFGSRTLSAVRLFRSSSHILNGTSALLSSFEISQSSEETRRKPPIICLSLDYHTNLEFEGGPPTVHRK